MAMALKMTPRPSITKAALSIQNPPKRHMEARRNGLP